MPSVDEGGFIIDYVAPAGHVRHRDRPPAAAGRADPSRHAGSADLLAPHRLQPRRGPERVQHRRLLRPPQAAAAPADQGGAGRGREEDRPHRPGPGHRDRPAHGRPDRRPDGQAPAGRRQPLLRRPGAPGGPGREGASRPWKRSTASRRSRAASSPPATRWTWKWTASRRRWKASTPSRSPGASPTCSAAASPRRSQQGPKLVGRARLDPQARPPDHARRRRAAAPRARRPRLPAQARGEADASSPASPRSRAKTSSAWSPSPAAATATWARPSAT